MGRYKTYRSPKAFSDAVDAYFNSISRTVTVKEKVDSGERDKKGHVIYESKPVLNDFGQEIRIREYIVPPSLRDLCLDYLCITRQTWANYKKDPKYLDTITRARGRVEAFLAREVVTREKNTKGIEFTLMEDFGWREKLDVNEHQSVEDYLKNLQSSGQDTSEF